MILSRLALVAFAVMSLIGIATTWSVFAAESASRQSAFNSVLIEAVGSVETRIEQHIALLTATRAFLETRSGAPDRNAFAAFVRGLGLEGPYSGLQGIGFSRILRSEAEAEAEANLVRDYGADRGIWPEAVTGLRTAIVLLEPADARNRVALGFDMAT